MTDDRWDNLVKMITSRFEIEDDYAEELSEEDGGGYKDVLVCSAPIGKIKLERYVRPVVLGKKTIYSKRGGGDTSVEYKYSTDENSQHLKVYKFDDFNDRWQEVNSNNFLDVLS